MNWDDPTQVGLGLGVFFFNGRNPNREVARRRRNSSIVHATGISSQWDCSSSDSSDWCGGAGPRVGEKGWNWNGVRHFLYQISKWKFEFQKLSQRVRSHGIYTCKWAPDRHVLKPSQECQLQRMVPAAQLWQKNGVSPALSLWGTQKDCSCTTCLREAGDLRSSGTLHEKTSTSTT